jgi:hypothetical protein
MKNKIILGTIVGILSIITIIFTTKEKPIENKYEILDNEYSSYKYISTYEQYKDFIERKDDNKITRKLTENDFKNKKYLFYTIPVDSCSETIENDKIEKENSKYKIYFDVSYNCGVCPLEYVTYIYEIEEELYVEAYTKTISRETCDPNVSYKPIIYIYPKEDMDLTIKLKNEKDLLYTYPKYKESWNVRVSKDGNIYDYDTKRNYYGLYWEGIDNYKLNMDEGFVVKGKDSVKFLEEKLEILGLNEYEINEFIIYWIDKLESNEYNFISFRNEKDINMPLEFSKQPDTLIRIMMDFKSLDKPIKVKEQQLTKIERKGFTIVEWGGTYHK